MLVFPDDVNDKHSSTPIKNFWVTQTIKSNVILKNNSKKNTNKKTKSSKSNYVKKNKKI